MAPRTRAGVWPACCGTIQPAVLCGMRMPATRRHCCAPGSTRSTCRASSLAGSSAPPVAGRANVGGEGHPRAVAGWTPVEGCSLNRSLAVMKANRMNGKIARGEPAPGCSVMFPSPQIVEMLGCAGFDWVLIDCEHGSIGANDVELMAMACDAAGITPIARPKTNSASDIQAIMDRGVMGVQVPHVNTGDDARRAVAAVKFGAGSARGLAAGTRPDAWGMGARMADFAEAANAQSLICVQLEHEAALANIDAILAVEGIDVFFIGPSDLSQSMGHPGNPQAPP